jgi:hypothetical protein
MPGVAIEAKNRLDRKTYCASIVPKHQAIEYWLAPTLSPGEKKPRSVAVTLTATATARRSMFSSKNPPPLLIVCYGIGGLQFDAFCALVVDILSSCDMSALRSIATRMAVIEICGRHDLIADQGEFRFPQSARPVPIVMLFDRNSTARGY